MVRDGLSVFMDMILIANGLHVNEIMYAVRVYVKINVTWGLLISTFGLHYKTIACFSWSCI